MTTTTYRYRAQTDATIKAWHLGAAERGNVCFCGTKLMTPDDTRAFALKVPAEKRKYETSDDLTRVTCRSCKRNREWSCANGAERPATTATTRHAGTRTATPADAEAGMNEYTAAQLLVDGVQARARNAAAAKETAGQVSGGTVIEAGPVSGLPGSSPSTRPRPTPSPPSRRPGARRRPGGEPPRA